jgi:5'-3' exonuclease
MKDSDLLVYSAACGVPFPILYKFDKAGTVQCLDLYSIGLLDPRQVATRGVLNSNQDNNTKKSGGGFIGQLGLFRGPSGRRMFVQMCILAGCDYCESVPGIGLVFAQQALVRFKDSTDDLRMSDIINHFMSAGKKVPAGYLERCQRVEVYKYSLFKSAR